MSSGCEAGSSSGASASYNSSPEATQHTQWSNLSPQSTDPQAFAIADSDQQANVDPNSPSIATPVGNTVERVAATPPPEIVAQRAEEWTTRASRVLMVFGALSTTQHNKLKEKNLLIRNDDGSIQNTILVKEVAQTVFISEEQRRLVLHLMPTNTTTNQVIYGLQQWGGVESVRMGLNYTKAHAHATVLFKESTPIENMVDDNVRMVLVGHGVGIVKTLVTQDILMDSMYVTKLAHLPFRATPRQLVEKLEELELQPKVVILLRDTNTGKPQMAAKIYFASEDEVNEAHKLRLSSTDFPALPSVPSKKGKEVVRNVEVPTPPAPQTNPPESVVESIVARLRDELQGMIQNMIKQQAEFLWETIQEIKEEAQSVKQQAIQLGAAQLLPESEVLKDVQMEVHNKRHRAGDAKKVTAVTAVETVIDTVTERLTPMFKDMMAKNMQELQTAVMRMLGHQGGATPPTTTIHNA
ncbi:hypothetical protein BGZ73_007784 [Actinomortierella ambigua]|nr:hypothetical protein BGZ73_007784 [Actinomortierella ambigua]